MRLAWPTDIHLNFVDDGPKRQFLEKVRKSADAVALSGDIAESHDVAFYLQEIEEIVQKPIYFVLGNHDFYKDSVARTRKLVAELVAESRFLCYLTALEVVELTPQTAIGGHDGWADGRFGDYEGTEVILNDHLLIAELAQWFKSFDLDRIGLSKTLTMLADQAAQHFEHVLDEAVKKYPNIIAVTHVPPFREAAW
jgi:3',5'-cyclic-AMP phosphodiesterase